MANLVEVNVRLSRYLLTYYKLQRHCNKYSKFSSIGYVELSKNNFKIRQRRYMLINIALQTINISWSKNLLIISKGRIYTPLNVSKHWSTSGAYMNDGMVFY